MFEFFCFSIIRDLIQECPALEKYSWVQINKDEIKKNIVHSFYGKIYNAQTGYGKRKMRQDLKGL